MPCRVTLHTRLSTFFRVAAEKAGKPGDEAKVASANILNLKQAHMALFLTLQDLVVLTVVSMCVTLVNTPIVTSSSILILKTDNY